MFQGNLNIVLDSFFNVAFMVSSRLDLLIDDVRPTREGNYQIEIKRV